MEYSINLDAKVQKEFHKRMKTNSLISFVIGAVLFLAFMVVFGIIVALSLQPSEWVYVVLEIVMCVGTCFLSCGVVIFESITNGDKKIIKNNLTFDCELYKDNFILTIRNMDVCLFSGKIYYVDLLKIKETDNYIFMCLSNRVAIPIPKKEFTNEELLEIKLMIYAPQFETEKFKL